MKKKITRKQGGATTAPSCHKCWHFPYHSSWQALSTTSWAIIYIHVCTYTSVRIVVNRAGLVARKGAWEIFYICQKMCQLLVVRFISGLVCLMLYVSTTWLLFNCVSCFRMNLLPDNFKVGNFSRFNKLRYVDFCI